MMHIYIEWYNIVSHKELIAELLAKRSMPQSIIKDLPARGVVSFTHGVVPIGATFLRIIEGNFGIIDGMITNPEVDKESRNYALNQMVSQCLLLAKEMGLSSLFGFSRDQSIYKRALLHGFKHEENIKMFSLSLNGGMGLWDF